MLVASANCQVAACGGGLLNYLLAVPLWGNRRLRTLISLARVSLASTRAVREARAGPLQGGQGRRAHGDCAGLRFPPHFPGVRWGRAKDASAAESAEQRRGVRFRALVPRRRRPQHA